MPASRTKPDGKKVNPHPAAHHIAARTKELAVLARYDGCEDLAYMLEPSTIEAENADLRYWLVYGPVVSTADCDAIFMRTIAMG
jgi:hypothetical protein